MRNCMKCGKFTSNRKFCSPECYQVSSINVRNGRRLVRNPLHEKWLRESWEAQKKSQNMVNDITPARNYIRLHPEILSDAGRRAHYLHPEIVEKLTKFNKTKESRERQRISALEKGSIWEVLKHRNFSPSGPEQRVFGIIMTKGLPYDFVGDSRAISIGGKFPDFVHRTKKLVVEVAMKKEKEFRNKITWGEWQRKRISHFSFYGFGCLFLWADMNDEKIIEVLRNESNAEPKRKELMM